MDIAYDINRDLCNHVKKEEITKKYPLPTCKCPCIYTGQMDAGCRCRDKDEGKPFYPWNNYTHGD
jgi:hypothetical protein